MNNSNVWLEAGYHNFAVAGLKGIPVERLAKALDLNKSGYYHYFGNQDNFLERLMDHHIRKSTLLACEIHSMKKFDPDFFDWLIKYTDTTMVHMQLVRYRHLPLFSKSYKAINAVVDRAIVPSWAHFIGTPENPELALKYFQQVRDMFYSRITLEDMNPVFIRNLFGEARELVQELISESIPS